MKDRVAFEQLATSASFEWRVSERVTLSAAGGGLFMGALDRVETGPGAVGSLGVSWLVLEQKDARPFVQLSGSLAVSGLRVASDYLAIDGRIGVAAGYTIQERLTPYLVARAFGGPVFYAGSVGTDLFHYQLGAGVVVGLPLGLDLSFEGIPLGEQRLTLGLGASF